MTDSTDPTTAMQESTKPDSTDERRRNTITGGVLVLAGSALLGLQLVEGVGESLWLLFVGTVFVAAYLYLRIYGLLVPGGIIVGVALGQIADRAVDWGNEIEAIGIGIGFLSIYAIDRAYTGHSHWWPLIPGGILVVIGVASITPMTEFLLPALLILAGVGLILRLDRGRRTG